MMLEVRNLKVNFNTPRGVLQAVRGVSFNLKKGEFLGIVGESGSGKSVTSTSIMNLIPHNGLISGEVLMNGKKPLTMSGQELLSFRGPEIAMIFQEPGRSFDPIYNIRKTFFETFKAHEPLITEADSEIRTIKLLKEVYLTQPENRLKNFPHQFSGGQLQRIMIALALASEPKLLIADEPTTALDVTIQAEIVELLKELKNSRKLAVIFITHDIELVSRMADRIIVMYNGLIMENNTAQNIIHNPHHPYTRGLLDSLPGFGNHYSTHKLVSIPGTVPDPIYPIEGCPFAPRCSLVKNECNESLPDLNGKDGTYRCIIDGPKEVSTCG